MPVKTIAIQPSLTAELITEGGVFSRITNTFSHKIGKVDATSFALYEWDISGISSSLLPFNAIIQNIEIEFWTFDSDNMILEIVYLPSILSSSSTTDQDLFFRVHNPSSSVIIDQLGSEKESHTSLLLPNDNPRSPESQFGLSIREDSRSFFSIGFRGKNKFRSTTEGTILIGGNTLMEGTEWSEATGLALATPPLLYITYITKAENFPDLRIVYTTEDPLSKQSSPSNSIGGYAAITSDVYSRSRLGAPISSTQTTIPIDISDPLPERVGLAAVGPEIFKYEGIDETNYQLTGVTRGISPAAFPAGIDSYNNLEFVRFLHKDQKIDTVEGIVLLDRLFDFGPTGLVQYRCIAVFHSGFNSTVDFSIRNPKIHLFQNPNDDVQIDVGIEVPAFDSYTTGKVQTVESEQIFVDREHFGDPDFETGFFAGAHIRFPELGNTAQIVDTFDEGEFILQSAVAGLVVGQPFIIYPAVSQRIANDSSPPVSNSGAFLGFLGEGGSNVVILNDHGALMQPKDVFYVWVKRTLTKDVDPSNDTGAILSVEYQDEADQT